MSEESEDESLFFNDKGSLPQLVVKKKADPVDFQFRSITKFVEEEESKGKKIIKTPPLTVKLSDQLKEYLPAQPDDFIFTKCMGNNQSIGQISLSNVRGDLLIAYGVYIVMIESKDFKFLL